MPPSVFRTKIIAAGDLFLVKLASEQWTTGHFLNECLVSLDAFGDVLYVSLPVRVWYRYDVNATETFLIFFLKCCFQLHKFCQIIQRSNS